MSRPSEALAFQHAANQTASTTRVRSSSLARLLALVLLGGATCAVHADSGDFYVAAQVYGMRDSDQGGGDLGAGLSLGIGMSDWLSLEASYKQTHLEPAVPSGQYAGIDGIEVALRGRHPLSERFSLTSRLGVYRWKASNELDSSADRGTDPVAGVGAMLQLSERVAISADYERILGFDTGLEEDRIALGVRLAF